MFEDLTPQPNPPSNLPTEPVDMFADVDKSKMPVEGIPAQPPNALSAGLLKKKEPRIQAPPDLDSLTAQTQTYKMSEPVFGKVIYALIIVAVVAGLGGAGWWAYSKYIVKTDKVQIQAENQQGSAPVSGIDAPPASEQTPAPASVQEAVTIPTSDISNEVKSDSILFGNSVDTDKDGLSDAREKQVGTDPQTSDSDADELSDGDEVLIWHSDPLKADTDGDGYSDGQEVRSGYDPLGPGKLFNIPAPTSSVKSTSTK